MTTIAGESWVRCVYLADRAELDGFTLTGGCRDEGGGVYCASASAIVSRCILRNNAAIAKVGHCSEPADVLGNSRGNDGDGDGWVGWDIGAYELKSFKPPRFNAQPQLTANGWRFIITGAPNKWVGLQRTSDFTRWWDVQPAVVVGSDGVCEITDADTGPEAMFYRAVVLWRREAIRL
jgi:hypothetical protein